MAGGAIWSVSATTAASLKIFDSTAEGPLFRNAAFAGALD